MESPSKDDLQGEETEEVPSDFFEGFDNDFMAGLDELDAVSAPSDSEVLTEDIKQLKTTNEDLKREIEALRQKTGGPRYPAKDYRPRGRGGVHPRGHYGSPKHRRSPPWRGSSRGRAHRSRSPRKARSPYDSRKHSKSPRSSKYDSRARKSSSHKKRKSSKSGSRRRKEHSHDSIPDLGPRRDAGKVYMAIKQDKEMKVKEYLSKRLESSGEDMAPPGTELDDYFSDKKLGVRDGQPARDPIQQRIVPHLPHLSKNYDLRNVMSRRVSPPAPQAYQPAPVQYFPPARAPGPIEPPLIDYTPTAPYYQQVPRAQFCPPTSIVPEPRPAPVMVPEPLPAPIAMPIESSMTQLDKLFAEGKISEHDYMMLRPKPIGQAHDSNKNAKQGLITDCKEAIKKLSKLHLPSKIFVNASNSVKSDPAITPKYCSPLKRERIVEFTFTTSNKNVLEMQNKLLLESVVSALGINKVIAKHKLKKSPKFKEVGVQTTETECEACSIRKSFKYNSVSTQIDRDELFKSVQTQVIDSELATSKTVFGAGGSNAVSNPISFAHMTPAQLVSQLAAKARNMQGGQQSQSQNFRDYQGYNQSQGSSMDEDFQDQRNYPMRSGNYPNKSGNYQGQSGNYQDQSGNYQGQSGNNQDQSGNYQGQSGKYQGQSGKYQDQSGNYQGQSGNYQGQSSNYRNQSGTFHSQNKSGNYQNQPGNNQNQSGGFKGPGGSFQNQSDNYRSQNQSSERFQNQNKPVGYPNYNARNFQNKNY